MRLAQLRPLPSLMLARDAPTTTRSTFPSALSTRLETKRLEFSRTSCRRFLFFPFFLPLTFSSFAASPGASSPKLPLVFACPSFLSSFSRLRPPHLRIPPSPAPFTPLPSSVHPPYVDRIPPSSPTSSVDRSPSFRISSYTVVAFPFFRFLRTRPVRCWNGRSSSLLVLLSVRRILREAVWLVGEQ
jgi:hypothetical protein